MNAKQARQASQENATRITYEKQEEQKRKNLIENERLEKERTRWRANLMSALRSKINYAVDHGHQKTEYTLWSGPSSESALKLYGSAYLENAVFAPELKSIMAELESDGYLLAIIGRPTQHDESAAYLNSGGECGSNRPFWTYDTILDIRW